MKFRILGTESLGVRGLSCIIEAGNRRILVDPGVALGFTRYGLHPHPIQAAVGEIVRGSIVEEWKRSTDIIITHFHGDHTPLYNANPFQLGLRRLRDLRGRAHLWVKSEVFMTWRERLRAQYVYKFFHEEDVVRGGCSDHIVLSKPVPHGASNNTSVVLVAVRDGRRTLVHMSDTQLLSEEAVEIALSWEPDIVITDGPPLYRWHGNKSFHRKMLKKAWRNAWRIACSVDTLIIDHHLMRCMEGLKWVDSLSEETGANVLCAADITGKPALLLEAWRKLLYEKIPVPNDWYIDYGRGTVCLKPYREIAKRLVEELPTTRFYDMNIVDEILDNIVSEFDPNENIRQKD